MHVINGPVTVRDLNLRKAKHHDDEMIPRRCRVDGSTMQRYRFDYRKARGRIKTLVSLIIIRGPCTHMY